MRSYVICTFRPILLGRDNLGDLGANKVMTLEWILKETGSDNEADLTLLASKLADMYTEHRRILSVRLSCRLVETVMNIRNRREAGNFLAT